MYTYVKGQGWTPETVPAEKYIDTTDRNGVPVRMIYRKPEPHEHCFYGSGIYDMEHVRAFSYKDLPRGGSDVMRDTGRTIVVVVPL